MRKENFVKALEILENEYCIWDYEILEEENAIKVTSMGEEDPTVFTYYFDRDNKLIDPEITRRKEYNGELVKEYKENLEKCNKEYEEKLKKLLTNN
jgi:hypothetical protein